MTTLTQDEAYTAAEAARVLGLSPKRVRQLAGEGRLDVVEAGPLRVSAVSVLRVRDERRDDVHFGLLVLGCCLILFRALQT